MPDVLSKPQELDKNWWFSILFWVDHLLDGLSLLKCSTNKLDAVFCPPLTLQGARSCCWPDLLSPYPYAVSVLFQSISMVFAKLEEGDR